jgi:hypothetical protein
MAQYPVCAIMGNYGVCFQRVPSMAARGSLRLWLRLEFLPSIWVFSDQISGRHTRYDCSSLNIMRWLATWRQWSLYPRYTPSKLSRLVQSKPLAQFQFDVEQRGPHPES